MPAKTRILHLLDQASTPLAALALLPLLIALRWDPCLHASATAGCRE